MTKVLCEINDRRKSIYFDCMNHAGLKDVCIICSTLCKVILSELDRANIGKVQISDGHVSISIDAASDITIATFESVLSVFKEVEAEFPDYCKVY